MTNIEQQVRNIFSHSVECVMNNCDELAPKISQASVLIANQLLEGKTIYTCGNGGGAVDAQYFSSRLINRFEHERPSLPSVCLSADIATITSIANDQNFNEIFSKPIKSLAKSGDVLLVISTNEKSSNLVQAVQAAHEKNMFVIVLCGNGSGNIELILDFNDIEIRVQSESNARIKECNLLSLNCMCELIEQQLFGWQ